MSQRWTSRPKRGDSDIFDAIIVGCRGARNRDEATERSTMEGSMSVRVIVCEGCCCGNLEKGYDDVPKEFLERVWEENNLGEMPS